MILNAQISAATADPTKTRGPSLETTQNVLQAGKNKALRTAAVEVNLSEEGKKAADKDLQRNAGVDASSLPDNIKKSLKAIRELQQKLSEKADELSKLAADKSLAPEAKDSRSKQLQIEIASLRTALTSSESALNQAMSAQRMSAKDRSIAHSLAGKI